jgi:hypothetical protein
VDRRKAQGGPDITLLSNDGTKVVAVVNSKSYMLCDEPNRNQALYFPRGHHPGNHSSAETLDGFSFRREAGRERLNPQLVPQSRGGFSQGHVLPEHCETMTDMDETSMTPAAVRSKVIIAGADAERVEGVFT